MNKFVGKTIIFLALTAVTYVVALFFWETYMPSILKPNIQYHQRVGRHLTDVRIADISNHKDVDLLFLGSSHTYRGFDNRLFEAQGYSSFNLGSSAQTPLQTKVLLNRYLEKLNPKMVIFEVFPANFYLDGVESSLDLISNDENDFQSVEMALRLNNIKTYNTMLYGFMHDLIYPDKNKQPILHDKDTYISGGFVERELEFFDPNSMAFDDLEIALEGFQYEAFNEVLEDLKAKGIEVLIVYAPIPKVLYRSYKNKEAYDSLISKQATYYNFNELLEVNDSLHFYDYNHLNQNGVDLFNKALIEVLNKDYKHLLK